MSFIKSVLFGNEGSYNVFGVDVYFVKEPPKNMPIPPSGIPERYIKIINYILRSRIFAVVTQCRLHNFIHEIGHLVVGLKVLHAEQAKIIIIKDISFDKPLALTTIKARKFNGIKYSFLKVAGPMTGVAFASCELMLATAMRNLCTVPSYILGIGAVFSILNELLYAGISITHYFRSNGSHSYHTLGDFGDIARNSKKHLALASLALISECALGIFGAYKLL